MANMIRNRLAQVSANLELPGELIAGVPKIEVTGYGELVLEHHNGIAHYSDSEVSVRVSLGMVRILGKELYIRRMNSRLITIRGSICSVSLEGPNL